MNYQKSIRLLKFLTTFFLFLISSCSDKTVGSKDIEYRTDENGSKILYEITKSSPFGFRESINKNTEPDFVVDYFTDEEIKKHKIELGLWDSFLGIFQKDEEHSNERYRIGFLNGLKHGPFEFRHPNGKIRLTGNYKKGKRHGKFASYGKIGELIYEKNFRNGDLDGNFSLYYVASESDIYRYKETIRKNKKLLVKNHIRLRAKFERGNPIGSYKAYYHPRGRIDLEESDLLKEEGFFDENGLLASDQTKFYPKTEKLFVVLPDETRVEFQATDIGFSRAIDSARSSIRDLPASRNPQKKPALVYSADEKGNLISPIWSSHIDSIEIRYTSRDKNKTIEKFGPPPTYEAFINEALPKAQALVADKNSTLANQGLQIVGVPQPVSKNTDDNSTFVNNESKIVDEMIGNNPIFILWDSRKSEKIIPLHQRIFAKRTKTKRKWKEGTASSTSWFLNDGTMLPIRDRRYEMVDFNLGNP